MQRLAEQTEFYTGDTSVDGNANTSGIGHTEIDTAQFPASQDHTRRNLLLGGSAVAVTALALAGCGANDLPPVIPQAGAKAEQTPRATETPEGPRYRTNESYADYLWLHQGKLTADQQKDYAAMTANNPLARAERRYNLKSYSGGYNELPTEGMIVFANTKVETAPVGPNTPDGKLLTGTVDFGFFKDGIPYLVKMQVTSVDSHSHTIYNFGSRVSASDWTSISSFPHGDFFTADQMDAYFKANVGKEAIFGFSIPDPKVAGPNWVNTESFYKNANALIQWMRNNGSRPDFVIGPNATEAQIAQAPSTEVSTRNFSTAF